MRKDDIDHGAAFDWGKASADYARYRDIYPPAFYEKLLSLGLCLRGQAVLDLGTGTGVLPRHLYPHGARFTGVDISPEQISEARRLSREAGMDIDYIVSAAEDAEFPDRHFDVVTACQCFGYFDPDRLAPKLRRWLNPGGRLAICFMDWLTDRSDILRQSEQLILRYNPTWTGANVRAERVRKPAWADAYGFDLVRTESFEVMVPFTRERWNGRMKACRGIGASLAPEAVRRFEAEHLDMLARIAPDEFAIPHQIKMVILGLATGEVG